ncbi:hypothetical protein KDA11_05615, partial [Candidatus Saccharibacteria bacterium]|nr:hypothetical protein [Candidatus Saccharibacteria bacterium]
LRQQRRIQEGNIWFRAILNVEFSPMVVFENPYFPNPTKQFQFPIVSLGGITYILPLFQIVAALHDLYNPALASEWEQRLEAMKRMLPPATKQKHTKSPEPNNKVINANVLGPDFVIVNDRIAISSLGDNVTRNLEALYPNEYITAIANRGRVIGDARTTHTLYRVGGRDTVRVFDCTDFELVPTRKEGQRRIATRVVQARCELIVATMFALLGNPKALVLAGYILTQKYELHTLTLKELLSVQPEDYVGTNYPYDDYLKERSLETIRCKLAEKKDGAADISIDSDLDDY